MDRCMLTLLQHGATGGYESSAKVDVQCTCCACLAGDPKLPVLQTGSDS